MATIPAPAASGSVYSWPLAKNPSPSSRSSSTVPAVLRVLTRTALVPLSTRFQPAAGGSSHSWVTPARTVTPVAAAAVSWSSAAAAARPVGPPWAELRSVRAERAARVGCGASAPGNRSRASPGVSQAVISSLRTLITGSGGAAPAAGPPSAAAWLAGGTVVRRAGVTAAVSSGRCMTVRIRGAASGTPATGPSRTGGGASPWPASCRVKPSLSADSTGGALRRVVTASRASGE